MRAKHQEIQNSNHLRVVEAHLFLTIVPTHAAMPLQPLVYTTYVTPASATASSKKEAGSVGGASSEKEKKKAAMSIPYSVAAAATSASASSSTNATPTNSGTVVTHPTLYSVTDTVTAHLAQNSHVHLLDVGLENSFSTNISDTQKPSGPSSFASTASAVYQYHQRHHAAIRPIVMQEVRARKLQRRRAWEHLGQQHQGTLCLFLSRSTSC